MSSFRIERRGPAFYLFLRRGEEWQHRGTYRTYEQAFAVRMNEAPLALPVSVKSSPRRDTPAARAGGFAPSRIPDCVLWLQSGSIRGLDSGFSFGSWNDESNLHHAVTQSVEGQKPTFEAGLALRNGRPIVRFGADRHFIAESVAALFTGSDRPLSAFQAFKPVVSAVQERALWGFGNSASSNPFAAFQWIGSPTFKWRYSRRDDGGTIAVPEAGTPNSNWHYASLIFDGAVASLWVDGVLTIDAQAADVGTMTLDRFTVGSLRTDVYSEAYGGDLGELALMARAVDTRERLRMESWLRTRWGFA